MEYIDYLFIYFLFMKHCPSAVISIIVHIVGIIRIVRLYLMRYGLLNVLNVLNVFSLSDFHTNFHSHSLPFSFLAFSFIFGKEMTSAMNVGAKKLDEMRKYQTLLSKSILTERFFVCRISRS